MYVLTGYIYWTNRVAKTIQKIHIEERHAPVQTFVSSGISDPTGLSLDWLNRKLIWLDKGNFIYLDA